MNWPIAPPLPPLLPGQACVFRLALDLPVENLAALWPLLNEAEQARANRYIRAGHRREFTAAHGQMRQILGAYLELEPACVRFITGEHGKPALAGETALRFNLSDSQDVGLLALCAGQEVGVDLEAERDQVNIESLARRFFAPGEVERLLALPDEARRAAFFTCWARKEAYLKGRGLGLALSLSSFEVSFTPGEPPLLFDRLPEQIPSRDWRLYEIRPGPGYAGALAVAGSPVTVRCWDWQV